MDRDKRSLFAAVALITLVAGIAIGVWRYSPSSAPVSAPWLFELSFSDPKGRPIVLSTVRGQRFTVVNFWATWCPPCVEEMPELSRIHSDLSSKGIQVVGLAVDSPSNVRQFLASREFSYPLLVTGSSGSELAKKLGNTIDALPYTVLINEKGDVIKKKAGRIREDELKSWLGELR